MKSQALLVALIAFVVCNAATAPPKNDTVYSVLYNSGQYSLVEGQSTNAVAFGKMTNERISRGVCWCCVVDLLTGCVVLLQFSRLWVTTNGRFDSDMQAFAAGVLHCCVRCVC